MPPSKPKFTPKRHHGYSAVLFILGSLLPPLAVAARFGIGADFWLNTLLTICGYIPGHVHNFYIQNIRNNQNNRRTPKWASRYGLVDTTEIERKKKKSEWAQRYNDRLPESTHEGQAYAEGQVAQSNPSVDSVVGPSTGRPANANGEFWNEQDESYYGQQNTSSTSVGGRWHYPANFEDTVSTTAPKKKKKKEKKDRWARTEDAYSIQEDSSKKRKKKKSSRSSIAQEGDAYSQRSESQPEFPEDAEGGLYGSRPSAPENSGAAPVVRGPQEEFAHEF